MALSPLAFATAALTLSVVVSAVAHAEPAGGAWVSGTGVGDGIDWLNALDTAREFFSPSPTMQDVSMLYTPTWNGFVEGPTWSAWWTTNSYGASFSAAPFLPEPLRSFVANANALWFKWEGNGKTVGLDDPNPAPDGCLCDAAEPDGAYYKQGDGKVPIHDWALEETLSAVIMQAEQLLVDRDAAEIAVYLPLFNRTLTLIESRRNAATNLFFSGVSCNLMAPSYGAWLLPNGTRVPAFLAGMSVSFVGALDRVVQLETLAGGAVWSPMAATHAAWRDATLAGLPALLAPAGDYFVKFADPNGTRHGVLEGPAGAPHQYIEAAVNHDAVALGVAERVRPGLSEAIVARLTGPTVPTNPLNGGPGLRPFAFVITNAAGLDDMELPPDTWLWQYGTWVNGGAWATCEARMMLAYYRTGRGGLALASMHAQLGFAAQFRMDSPLPLWGSTVYQPDEPINLVYDMFAPPAALLRGLWDPVYSADALVLTPHLPGNVSAVAYAFPFTWGPHRLLLSAVGHAAGAAIVRVTVGGAAWPPALVTSTNVTLPWALMPAAPANLSVVLTYGASTAAEAEANEEQGAAIGGATPLLDHLAPPAPAPGPASPTPASAAAPAAAALRHPAAQAVSLRLLRSLVPAGAALWLEADTLAPLLADGAPVAAWPGAAAGSAAAAQADPARQPRFVAARSSASGAPAVRFDGADDFLAGALLLPAGAGASVVAVLADGGENSDSCCSGVFYSAPGCSGLGTKSVPAPSDDASGAANATVLTIDWSGSGDAGQDDLTGLQVVASVVYNASGAHSWADGCLQSTATGHTGAAGATFMVGSRNNERGRYFNGSLSAVLVWPRALNDSERGAAEAYLAAKYPAPANATLRCGPPPPNCTLPANLTAADARLGAFVAGMRRGGWADARYELAHALLALDSAAAWASRCAGLRSGTVTPLANRASEAAADASYVASALRLATGLATVLDGYAGSADPARAAIYAIWAATA